MEKEDKFKLWRLLHIAYCVSKDSINKSVMEVLINPKHPAVNELEKLNLDETKSIPIICLELIESTPSCVTYIYNDTTPLIEACKAKVKVVIEAILNLGSICNPSHIYTKDHYGYHDSALRCLLISYCGHTIPQVKEFSKRIIDIGGLNPITLYKAISECCSREHSDIALYIMNYIDENREKYDEIIDENYKALECACEYKCEDVAILLLQNEIRKNRLNHDSLLLSYEYAKENNLTSFLTHLNMFYTPLIISYENIKDKIKSNPKVLIGVEITEEIIDKLENKNCRIIQPNYFYICDYVKKRLNINVIQKKNGKFLVTGYNYG